MTKLLQLHREKIAIANFTNILRLLQFVRFEYLSAGYVSDFLSFLPDLIDRRLWESISRRLISPLKGRFRLQQARSFDGVISYLTEKHG
jgi:hypothetical protein